MPAYARRSYSVQFEWLYSDRVLKCTLNDVTRETIDDLTANISEIMTTWHTRCPKTPYLAVFDMTAPDVHMTPYLRRQSEYLAEVATDVHLTGRYAFVIAQGLPSHALGFYFRRVLSQHTPTLESAMFHTLDNAIAWLQECLD